MNITSFIIVFVIEKVIVVHAILLNGNVALKFF
jgi:hypothetical protein